MRGAASRSWARCRASGARRSFPRQVLGAALERVRQGADVTAAGAAAQGAAGELGAEWEGRFQHFEMEPMAAASIGQVGAVSGPPRA